MTPQYTVSANTNWSNYKQEYQRVFGEIGQITMNQYGYGNYGYDSDMMIASMAFEFGGALLGNIFELAGSSKGIHNNYDGRGTELRSIEQINTDITTTTGLKDAAVANQTILAKGLTATSDELKKAGVNAQLVDAHQAILDNNAQVCSDYKRALEGLASAQNNYANANNDTEKQKYKQALDEAQTKVEEAKKALEDEKQKTINNLEEAIQKTKTIVDKKVDDLNKELKNLEAELNGTQKAVAKDNSGLMSNKDYANFFTTEGTLTCRPTDDKQTATILKKAVAEYVTAMNKKDNNAQKIAIKKIKTTIRDCKFDYKSSNDLNQNDKTLIDRALKENT